MARRKNKRPTDGELEILQVLWERGLGTVREVFHALNEEREIGYTTVLKIVQIMDEKGLVRCDKTVRPQVYSPVKSQSETQRLIMGDLVDRVFKGSPGKLVLQALSTKKASPEERRKIRELLDRLERS